MLIESPQRRKPQSKRPLWWVFVACCGLGISSLPVSAANGSPIAFVAQQTGGRFGGSDWNRSSRSTSSSASVNTGTSQSSETPARSSSSDEEGSGGGIILVALVLGLSWIFLWCAKKHFLLGLAVFLLQTLLSFRALSDLFPWDALISKLAPEDEWKDVENPSLGAGLGGWIFGFSLLFFSKLSVVLARRLHLHGSAFVSAPYVPSVVIINGTLGVFAGFAGLCSCIAAVHAMRGKSNSVQRWWTRSQSFLLLLTAGGFWSVLALGLLFVLERMS